MNTAAILLVQIFNTIQLTSNSIVIPENTRLTTTSDAINSIINRFYPSSIVSIHRAANRNKTNLEVSDFIDATLDRSNETMVNIEDLTIEKTVEQSVYNLIFIDDVESFRYDEHKFPKTVCRKPYLFFLHRSLFKKIKRGKFAYSGYYTIVVTTPNLATFRRVYITKRILDVCWSVYITNVIVVWPPSPIIGDTKTLIYSYFPYSPTHCERVLPILLNRYQNGQFLSDRKLFPRKLENMFQCPIVVATFDFYPYTMVEKTTDRFYGFDVNVVQELAVQLNFSLNIQVPDDGNDRGFILENNTVTGIFGMVNIS